MIEAYKNFWKNAFDFSNRTSRAGFWWVILCNVIISFIIGTFIGFTGGMNADGSYNYSNIFVIIMSIYELACIIPGLALDVRRMHDINKSGWAILIVLIPLVGWIIWLIWVLKDSVNENNKYGAQV